MRTQGLLLAGQQEGWSQTHISPIAPENLIHFHPQSQPYLCSRNPAVVSLSCLTPSPMDHKDSPQTFLPLTHPSTPASNTIRHYLYTHQLNRPGKQASHTHHLLRKWRRKTETKEKSIHPMKKNPAQRPRAIPNPDDKMSILKQSNSQGNMSPLELAYHSRPWIF